MAPELFEGQPASRESDVYAFAMVCYEVVARGSWPFEGVNQLVIVRKVCDKGERPARPDGVPDFVWSLMERCWAQLPTDRPTFKDIVREMESWPIR